MNQKTKNMLYLVISLFIILVIAGVFFTRVYKKEGFSSGESFTLYYADWCPHCKSIKPIFAEWSKTGTVTVNKKVVKVSMVEADASPDVISAKGVKGFPTFMYEKGDGTSVEYNGERSPSAWEEFLSKN